eukprot:gnl/TRDRNA2_/TRDRNA2_63061_c0_seq2.p1 gnl/TRDRNA2_/TRDRNA2_63061_c0~~gnl/TRDRNA2_/TRDRNA2_63061_c0_seq2.p1  ORF type:complete len:218 (+),score=17.98 gnl/TRDRNA2_/TRDRNA2_63061_c0_seq2:166-819(+)
MRSKPAKAYFPMTAKKMQMNTGRMKPLHALFGLGPGPTWPSSRRLQQPSLLSQRIPFSCLPTRLIKACIQHVSASMSEHETAGWFTAKQRCAFHCPRDCQDRVNFKMTSDTGKILGIEHIVEPQVASHCMLVAGTAQSRCDCYCLDVAMTAEQVANNENVTSIADLVGYYASPEVCNVECSCMKDPPYMRRKVSVCLDEWRPYTTVDTNNKTNKTKR